MICSLLFASSYVLSPTPRAAPAGLVSRRASGLQMAELRITGNIQIGENQNGDAYVQGAAELKTTAQLLSTHEELLHQAP